MKRLITVLLLTFSTFASAEWQLIGSVKGSSDWYVDLKTKKVTGSKARIWILRNNTADGDKLGDKSTKSYLEIDCKTENIKYLSFTTYNGNMGNGEVTFSNPSIQDAGYPHPGSAMEIIFKIACGIK